MDVKVIVRIRYQYRLINACNNVADKSDAGTSALYTSVVQFKPFVATGKLKREPLGNDLLIKLQMHNNNNNN